MASVSCRRPQLHIIGKPTASWTAVASAARHRFRPHGNLSPSASLSPARKRRRRSRLRFATARQARSADALHDALRFFPVARKTEPCLPDETAAGHRPALHSKPCPRWRLTGGPQMLVCGHERSTDSSALEQGVAGLRAAARAQKKDQHLQIGGGLFHGRTQPCPERQNLFRTLGGQGRFACAG